MIDYHNFVILLESTKSAEGMHTFEIEQANDDGTFNTRISKTLESGEMEILYNSLKDTHELDTNFFESHPRFKLVV